MTRRGFLSAGLAAFFAVGGAAGYLVGRASVDSTPLPLSAAGVDPKVRWARAVANGPMVELWSNWSVLVQVVQTRAPDDLDLWHGVRRLAVALLEGEITAPADDRQLAARALATFIEGQSPPRELELEKLTAALRRLGQGR